VSDPLLTIVKVGTGVSGGVEEEHPWIPRSRAISHGQIPLAEWWRCIARIISHGVRSLQRRWRLTAERPKSAQGLRLSSRISGMEASTRPKIEVEGLDFFYGPKQALRSLSIGIEDRRITALIGPSGCGKSTFLRCLNRMNDSIPDSRMSGRILIDGEDISDPQRDLAELRRRVGMVFQKPNPFPQSVFNNVAFGPRVLGLAGGRGELRSLVEQSLRRAALWDEVGLNLDASALSLSLGEQQRLCIARVLAVEPEVILMDEPCSALDPIATLKIEELMRELSERYAIVIVTHNMQQAARVSDFTAMMMLDETRAGTIIESGPAELIFTRPSDKRTEDYITGRFG
jgi:phosphate transport system ATP-binding protein